MLSFRRTPLAWKNLTHDPRRLLIAVSGVTFAVVLMFMEQGFQNALFDSTVALVKNFDVDIVLHSKSRYSLSSSSRFPANKVMLARGCDGVSEAYAVYIENYMAGLRKPNYRSRPIRVVAFDIRADLLSQQLSPVLQQYRHLLLASHTAIIDEKSKESIYGIDPTTPTPEEPLHLTLASKDLALVGTFSLGTDFANDGTLLMSEENFADYFSFRELPSDPLSTVDLGVINCQEGADIEQVKKNLSDLLGSEVQVLTRDELIQAEIRFWDVNTPIGKIFRIGVFIGFIVGILICYQVLFNDISDHMPEFATLMAMGYSSRYFISLVVRESIYLALFGFFPGVVITWFLFQGISWQTGLPMTLNPMDIIWILIFTICMCVVSGLLAVRKLLGADPASLF